MKKASIAALLFTGLFYAGCKEHGAKPVSKDATAIFPIGDKGPAANFTGTAWVKTLLPDDSAFRCSIGNVVFEPGARTAWHYHPAGQILLVTAGKGYYQEKASRFNSSVKGTW